MKLDTSSLPPFVCEGVLQNERGAVSDKVPLMGRSDVNLTFVGILPCHPSGSTLDKFLIQISYTNDY